MAWKFIARNFNLAEDTDWKCNVSTMMCINDMSYDLHGQDGVTVGWLIIFGNET